MDFMFNLIVGVAVAALVLILCFGVKYICRKYLRDQKQDRNTV